jgi:hypothetical protein
VNGASRAAGDARAEAVVAQVRAAFADTPSPGDAFLQGSFDGCEPYEEARAFHGRHDWTALVPDFLDAHASALGFLSEGGFRFVLPAYLVADLRGQLRTADPCFHLTHGLHDFRAEHALGGRAFVRRTGPDVLLNPRRYGAMTWGDHARQRLSVFTREESAAIVAYLRHRRDVAGSDAERRAPDEALAAFWEARARSAPTAAELARHLAAEAEYAAALAARYGAAPG